MGTSFLFWWIYYPNLIQCFAYCLINYNWCNLRLEYLKLFLPEEPNLSREELQGAGPCQQKPIQATSVSPHCPGAVFSCSNSVNCRYNLQLHKHKDRCKGKAGYTHPGMEAEARQCRLRSTTELFPGNQEVLAWVNTACADRTHWHLSFLMIGLFKTSWCLLKEPEILKTLNDALKVVFAKMIVNFFFFEHNKFLHMQ